MRRLPRRVTIAGRVWRVRVVRDLCAEDGEDVEGLCVFRRRELLIDADQTPAERWSTLFHEMAHAALGRSKLRYGQEERLVAVLEEGLFPALRRGGWGG